MAKAHDLPPINFAALNDALLGRIDSLVPMWLPGGVMKNNEYFVHSVFRSEKTPSLSVRMSGDNIGCWRDHGGDDLGGDLLSLYAAINNLSQGKAAVQLAREHGLEDVAGVLHGRTGAPVEPLKPKPPAPAPKPPRNDEGWKTVSPIPDSVPAATFAHQYRTLNDIEHTATYSRDGALYGYVVRFRKSDGGKEPIPYTWCTSARDGASRWHWKFWQEPRPLYLPGGRSPISMAQADGTLPTVVLVEGEKKADILQQLLTETAPDVYVVASWPGGCKAWKKADWEWLAGTDVLLWPDCDGKRESLTAKEKNACVDDAAIDIAAAMKPVLPASKQVGMAAMLGIGALLRDSHGCTVQMLQIPEPLEVPDGWDCADAIQTDGWDGDRVLAFLGHAQPLPAGDSAKPPAEKKRDRPVNTEAAEGEFSGDGDEFQGYLDFLCSQMDCEVYEIPVNRKIILAALRKSPALRGCLGLNMLTGAPSTRLPWPWRSDAGPLEERDALRLGDWLSETYKIKAATKAALEEAIEIVTDQNRFHPICDWLAGLKHDGRSRIDEWYIHVLRKNNADLQSRPKLKEYLRLCGRFILLGLVNRAMNPGCKFDYSPVFEGLTGRGKSTFVRALVGDENFSDTHFDIGSGKEGMEQLDGIWGYELSELTALRRADSEQVKQFFSSQIDRFRGAYGKYIQKHPRQCVIFCSTNKKRYLFDLTGNRRFWPVWIDQFIDLEWLLARRDQLFAEAYALYLKGERYTPTFEEEEKYFVPQQKKRLVQTAVQSRMYELLTREGSPSGEGKVSNEININTKFIQLHSLVLALGTDAAKSTSLLEQQITAWLELNGWNYKRAGKAGADGARPYGYHQPKDWPPKDATDDDEDDDPARLAAKDDAPDEEKSDGSPAQGTTSGDDDYEPF